MRPCSLSSPNIGAVEDIPPPALATEFKRARRSAAPCTAVGISAVMSLATSLFSGRAIQRAFASLRESVERVGAGDVVSDDSGSGQEVAEVSMRVPLMTPATICDRFALRSSP